MSLMFSDPSFSSLLLVNSLVLCRLIRFTFKQRIDIACGLLLMLFKCLYIYLFMFGCVGSSLLLTGFLQLWRAGATLSCVERASPCGGFSCCGRRTGFSSCGTWAQQLWLVGSKAQAHQLWLTGLVAPRHVGSSQTRGGTRVPCIGRWILNHCAPGKSLLPPPFKR